VAVSRKDTVEVIEQAARSYLDFDVEVEVEVYAVWLSWIPARQTVDFS